MTAPGNRVLDGRGGAVFARQIAPDAVRAAHADEADGDARQSGRVDTFDPSLSSGPEGKVLELPGAQSSRSRGCSVLRGSIRGKGVARC